MRTIQLTAELSDETYRAYEDEAARRGVKVELLVQQTVNCLLHDLEEEEKRGPDCIVPS